MQTELRLDPSAGTARFKLEIEPASALPEPQLQQLLEFVNSAAIVVNAQALSPSEPLAQLQIVGDQLHFELDAQALPPAFWRVLVGLISSFDAAYLPLASLRVEQHAYRGRPCAEREILSIPYPAALASPGFVLEWGASTGRDVSVEIELVDGTPAATRSVIVRTLDAWLRSCEGGFFRDGEPPVTNAHDCAATDEVASQLLVARFEYFNGSESAFDALVNLLAFLHRQQRCIASVQIY